MRHSSSSFSLAIALSCLGATVAVAGPRPAGPDAPTARHRKPDCRRIRAEINLDTLEIRGNFRLDGTVAFDADGSGTAPPTAPATSSVFSGILTITTAHGELFLRETGMSSSRTGNPAGPLLASWGETEAGTGWFTGVTGDLFFAGRIVDDAFLVDVTGELCRPD